jgi:hypothetical protein
VDEPAEAVAQAEPAAEAQPAAKAEPPLETRLQAFFEAYLAAYKQRNILLFSRFFATDATENGKPFAAMVQTYLDLFQETDTAQLQLADLDWTESSQGITVDGRFIVDLHYKKGRTVTGAGPISFLLQEADASFLVKTLTYHFEH